MIPPGEKNKTNKKEKPALIPEHNLSIPVPEEPPLPAEETDLVQEEDPYENPPAFEEPEPAEGP